MERHSLTLRAFSTLLSISAFAGTTEPTPLIPSPPEPRIVVGI